MRVAEMHQEFKVELERVDSSDKTDFEPWDIDIYLNKAIWQFLKRRYGVSPTKQVRGFETDQARTSQLSNLHIKSPHLQPAITPTVLQSGLYEVNLNDLGQNINGQYFRYLFLTDATVKASKDGCTKYMELSHYPVDNRSTIYNTADWLWRRVNYNFGRSTFQHPHEVPTGNPQDPDTTAVLESGPGARFNNDELSSLYLDTRDKYGESQFSIDEVMISYIKYPNRVFYGGYDHIDGLSLSTSPSIDCDIDGSFHDEIVRIAARLAQKDIESNSQLMMQDEIQDLQY